MSGGNQYIHRESEVRQDVLNRCFWPSSLEAFRASGIAQEAAEQHGRFRILEIGCGAGFTTLSLTRALCKAEVTAIDTSEDMIASARKSLDCCNDSDQLKGRISFRVLGGEEAATEYGGTFDAVWLRFVVVHVPNPSALLRSARDCLKAGGTLLVEDCDASGSTSDPPLYANTLFHDAHALASRNLGADIGRGPMIGSYFRELGLDSIHCNSFVPMFGKGVTVLPWFGPGDTQVDSQEAKFSLGLQLLEMSLFGSLKNKFLEMKLCAEEDLLLAKASIENAASPATKYQIFTIPGKKIFQWWAFKRLVD